MKTKTWKIKLQDFKSVTIPDEELAACCLYEYARECDSIVETVLKQKTVLRKIKKQQKQFSSESVEWPLLEREKIKKAFIWFTIPTKIRATTKCFSKIVKENELHFELPTEHFPQTSWDQLPKDIKQRLVHYCSAKWELLHTPRSWGKMPPVIINNDPKVLKSKIRRWHSSVEGAYRTKLGFCGYIAVSKDHPIDDLIQDFIAKITKHVTFPQPEVFKGRAASENAGLQDALNQLTVMRIMSVCKTSDERLKVIRNWRAKNEATSAYLETSTQNKAAKAAYTLYKNLFPSHKPPLHLPSKLGIK